MSSKSLGTLTLNLLVQTSSFVEGMNKSERATQDFAKNTKKNLADAGKAFVSLVAGATAFTAALIKSSIDADAAIDDISQTTGIAAEKISALKYAAEFEGVAFETLSGSLNKFSKLVVEASTGSGDAADAFKAMNIELRNSDGTLKSSDELLLDIAERFAHMEDGATKAAYAQKFFGKTGAEIIPFLNRGRDGIKELTDEAERYGLIVSTKTAAAADAFNDNLHRLKMIVVGTGEALTASLLPQLVEFTDLVQDTKTQSAITAIVTGISDIGIKAVKTAVDLIGLSKFLGEAVAASQSGAAFGDLPRLEDQLKDIKMQIQAISNLDAKAGSHFMSQDRYTNLVKQKKATEDLIKLTEQLMHPAAAVVKDVEAPKKDAPDPAVLEAANKVHEAAVKKLEDYDKEIQSIQKLSEVLKLKAEIETGALKGVSEADQKSLMDKAALVDATEKQADANKILTDYVTGLIDAGEKQHEADLQHAQDKLDGYKQLTESLDRQIALFGDVSHVTTMFYDTTVGSLKDLNFEQANHLRLQAEDLDNLERIAKSEEKRKQKAAEQEKAWKELGLDAAKNVQSAFADALMGVEGNFGETLQRMAAEFTASSLLKMLGTFLQGTGNEALSTIGGFFAGQFAEGGMIGAGQWGIVGESGPEIVSGPAFVTGQKKTEDMIGGGGNSYTVNISLPGIRNANDANMAGASVKRAAMAGIQEAGRYA